MKEIRLQNRTTTYKPPGKKDIGSPGKRCEYLSCQSDQALSVCATMQERRRYDDTDSCLHQRAVVELGMVEATKVVRPTLALATGYYRRILSQVLICID